MSRFGKVISSTPVNIALFAIAAVLLLGSIVGGTQAALSYFSDTYIARLEASSIGVTLLENGNAVAFRDYEGDGDWNERTYDTYPDHARLLQKLEEANGAGQWKDAATFTVGKSYREELAVRNSGEIAEYVRVVVNKYWERPQVDENGNAVEQDGQTVYVKATDISPEYIKVNYADNSGWLRDTDASTVEREIFYYSDLLQPGQTTADLSKSVSVDSVIASKVTQIETENPDGTTTIKTVYDYDGTRFCLEATAYAVQEHNVVDAIHSAWGTVVNAGNGTLRLG